MIQNSTVEFYDTLYTINPLKWASGLRDCYVFESLKEYICQPLKMLDYGCGNGHTISFFHDFLGHGEYTGIDISEIALRLARNNAPYAQFYTSLPDGEWNLITILGVAEHFIDPASQLAEIGERLTTDGHLYLEVPNCLAYSDRKDEGYRKTYARADQDEWHLERNTWEKIIGDAGFDVIERKTGNVLAWEFIWILKGACNVV